MSNAVYFTNIAAAVEQRRSRGYHELEAEQSARLAGCLAHHWRGANSAWRRLVEAASLTEASLPNTPAGMRHIPLTTRDFLRAGAFDVHPNGPIDTVASTSGTTQSAIRIPHNRSMAKRTLFDNFLRVFALNGVADILPFYGVAHGSPEMASGSRTTMTSMSEQFGDAALMELSSQPLDHHIERIRTLGPRVVASSPAFTARMARRVLELEQGGISVERVIVGGAPLTSTDRASLRAFQPREILRFYPTTDAGALGACVEHRDEYQSFPETHLIEVVHEDGSHVQEGEQGLVAVTAFDSMAAPLIRYLVGDRVTYLGRSADGRVRFRDIRRSTDVVIFDSKLPLADIDAWRDLLHAQGIDVPALQLARRRDACNRETLVLRMETHASTDAERNRVVAAAIGLLRADRWLGYVLGLDGVPMPDIELFMPGQLLQGGFKLPSFVDESADPSIPGDTTC